jgi:lactate permease
VYDNLKLVTEAITRMVQPHWLSATGTGCFLSAIVSGLLLGVRPARLLKMFWKTLVRMRLAMIAISFMLGLGYVTRYSGLDAVLGLAFTRTGWLYPFLALSWDGWGSH